VLEAVCHIAISWSISLFEEENAMEPFSVFLGAMAMTSVLLYVYDRL